MSPAFGAVTRASEICRIGGDHPPWHSGPRSANRGNVLRHQQKTERSTIEPARNPKANVAHACPPGPEPRNRRKPDGTGNHQPERSGRAEPGSDETGPPGTARSTNQSTPPIGQRRKFLPCPAAPKPQHKNAEHQPNTDRTLIRTRNRQKTTAQKPNTSHNAFRQKVNRTRTELDKGPKSSPIVDLTKGQKSSETGTQKATPQSSQKRKKVLSPAPRQRHHRNHKSQVRRDQEPGTRPTSRKPVGQKQKPPKEAETGQKRHF